MDNRTVADGDPVADEAREIIREVQHGVILDVRVVADDDAVDVAAQHRAIPNARMRTKRHVADDDRSFGEVNALAELRFLPQKFVELLFRLAHAPSLIRFLLFARRKLNLTSHPVWRGKGEGLVQSN